jgi:hypothetical protein
MYALPILREELLISRRGSFFSLGRVSRLFAVRAHCMTGRGVCAGFFETRRLYPEGPRFQKSKCGVDWSLCVPQARIQSG